MLSVFARSQPVIEPSTMDELPTAFPLTEEAEIPVNPAPSPEKPVAVTVPMT